MLFNDEIKNDLVSIRVKQKDNQNLSLLKTFAI